MLNCEETTRLASDRLERRLTFGEWFNMTMHVLMCPFCRRFKKQIEWLREAVETMSGLDENRLEPLSPLTVQSKNRMRSALQDRMRR